MPRFHHKEDLFCDFCDFLIFLISNFVSADCGRRASQSHSSLASRAKIDNDFDFCGFFFGFFQTLFWPQGPQGHLQPYLFDLSHCALDPHI
jgi:hypothetical protein